MQPLGSPMQAHAGPCKAPHARPYLQRRREAVRVHRLGVLVGRNRPVDLEIADAVAGRAGAHHGAGAGRVRVAHAAARASLGAFRW